MIFVAVSARCMAFRCFLFCVVALICSGMAQQRFEEGNPWAIAWALGTGLSLFLAYRSLRNALRVAAAWWDVNFGNK